MVELEARVSVLEAHLEETVRRFQVMRELELELGATKQLALEAVAQAQDAVATSSPLEARLNHLTLAVAEGIQHVDRAEKRINGSVTRARRQLREAGLEHPGLEAEAAQLHLVDGGSGEAERVRDVPEVLEDPPTDPLLARLRVIGLSR